MVLAVLLGSAVGVASAVAVQTVPPDPPELSVQTSDTAELFVDNYVLNYTGSDVDVVTVTVNNEQATSLEGKITVELKRLDGTVVANGSRSGILFPVTGTNKVDVDVSPDVGETQFAWVVVTLNKTG